MNWQGELPRATPLSAFLVGLCTGAAIQFGLRQDINALAGQFLISVLLVGSIVLWFVFVVRGPEYEVKWWYGFRDLKPQPLVRAFYWLAGIAVTVLSRNVL